MKLFDSYKLFSSPINTEKFVRQTGSQVSRLNWSRDFWRNIIWPTDHGILTEGNSQYSWPPHEGSRWNFVKKVNKIFNIKRSWSKMVSTRRPIVLSFPLHWEFPKVALTFIFMGRVGIKNTSCNHLCNSFKVGFQKTLLFLKMPLALLKVN